jgi:GNAT superfamily N-acetyltransferase
MPRLSLAPAADLRVFYAADSARYAQTRGHMLQVVTEAAFVRYFAGCPSLGFECDGQPIGGVIFDGREAHIAVLPEHRGRWAWLLKPAIDWLFSLKPQILVEIERDNAACIAFMDRNGWRRVSASEHAITYLMEHQGGTGRVAHTVRRARR